MNQRFVDENPYQLPTTVVPERYDIRLEPNLTTFTFVGEQSVAITVREPVTEIVLNALELEIDKVSVEAAGKTFQGRARLDEQSERAHLIFDRTLEPGRWLLKISFCGTLNDKLHGFYRSQYRDEQGRMHMLAATQFEATDARRAFPCWDEPAIKAVFKVTLVVDEHLSAISNTATESEQRVGGGRKAVVFKDTIKMSTYLLAFIVGELEVGEAVDVDGTPLRVVFTPGKARLANWAREVGAFSLKFFADYYQRPYPGDKLDLIAIPDFASGAMENLGAITFRETALLVDEKQASRAELERVADVVSHENAHMWFGDLVTMRWWNGLWLNEAFATFMEMVAVDAWKPNWRRWDSFSASRAAAMAIDGLNNTRPIEFEVKSPDDARAMFDVLTYEKGAAVLRMLEQYLGPEHFREGIRLYLRRHEFANAETSDLWDALEEASGQPVRKLMDSWIFQPGLPILEVEQTPDRRALLLKQRRFLYLPALDAEAGARWHVPLMVKARTDRGVSTQRLLMDAEQARLELPAPAQWALLNHGAHGFYRVRYSASMLDALTGALDEFDAVERFMLVGDTWAAVVAGLTPLRDFFKMAARVFRDETDINVWRALLGPLNYLDMVAPAAARQALAAKTRALASPALARLGWTPAANEDRLISQLRGALVDTLGTLGDDREVISRATELYQRYRRAPNSVDPDLVPALISVVAYSGDEARYDEFRKNFQTARTPQDEQRYLFALADFQRPELLRRTMEMTVNDEVRTQNAPYLMHSLLVNRACCEEAWDFIKRHWNAMTEKYPESALPRMCEGIVALVDREAEVMEFFATHKVKQGGKTIDQHLERLKIAAAFKRREGARLAREIEAS
jgi:puromycin-sensitive aminopeptidase